MCALLSAPASRALCVLTVGSLPDALELLVAWGASAALVDSAHGESALHVACRNGQVLWARCPAVKDWVGCWTFWKESSTRASSWCFCSRSLLLLPRFHGCLSAPPCNLQASAVQLLAGRWGAPYAGPAARRHRDGYSPLHEAARWGHHGCAQVGAAEVGEGRPIRFRLLLSLSLLSFLICFFPARRCCSWLQI